MAAIQSLVGGKRSSRLIKKVMISLHYCPEPHSLSCHTHIWWCNELLEFIVTWYSQKHDKCTILVFRHEERKPCLHSSNEDIASHQCVNGSSLVMILIFVPKEYKTPFCLDGEIFGISDACLKQTVTGSLLSTNFTHRILVLFDTSLRTNSVSL